MRFACTAVIPVLSVRAISEALQFYCERLGFKEDWRRESGTTRIAQVSRSGLVLRLSEAHSAPSAIVIEGYALDQLADEIARRFRPERAPEMDETDARRRIVLRDPFENELTFLEIFRRMEALGDRLDYMLVRMTRDEWFNDETPAHQNFLDKYLKRSWTVVLTATMGNDVDIVLYRALSVVE